MLEGSYKPIGCVMWRGQKGAKRCYMFTHQNKKPYCKLRSKDEDVTLLEKPCENVYANIRHTKDFNFVTVNITSTTNSKVHLINAAYPLSGLTLVWECETCAHCIIEYHQGYFFSFHQC